MKTVPERVPCPRCKFSTKLYPDKALAQCLNCGNVWDWRKVRVLRAAQKGLAR
jgi:hypothetical protein